MTLHKYCCSKGGIGVRPPPTSQRNDWRPCRLLVGCPGQVVLTLHGCCPEGTCALLPSASIGDWDHSFPMNVWKLRCCSLPWCLALTSLCFPSTPKNELGYSSCLLPRHCGGSPSALFTSWAPGIATPFPLPPFLQICERWKVSQYHPPCCMTSAAGLFLQKTYAAADKSPELFLPPFSQSQKFITSKTYPEWKRAKQPGDCCSWLQHLLEPH